MDLDQVPVLNIDPKHQDRFRALWRLFQTLGIPETAKFWVLISKTKRATIWASLPEVCPFPKTPQEEPNWTRVLKDSLSILVPHLSEQKTLLDLIVGLFGITKLGSFSSESKTTHVVTLRVSRKWHLTQNQVKAYFFGDRKPFAEKEFLKRKVELWNLALHSLCALFSHKILVPEKDLDQIVFLGTPPGNPQMTRVNVSKETLAFVQRSGVLSVLWPVKNWKLPDAWKRFQKPRKTCIFRALVAWVRVLRRVRARKRRIRFRKVAQTVSRLSSIVRFWKKMVQKDNLAKRHERLKQEWKEYLLEQESKWRLFVEQKETLECSLGRSLALLTNQQRETETWQKMAEQELKRRLHQNRVFRDFMKKK